VGVIDARRLAVALLLASLPAAAGAAPLNPFKCRGEAEAVARDLTIAEIRVEIARRVERPPVADEPAEVTANDLCVVAELKRRVGGSVIEVHVRHRDDLANIAEALARLDHGEAQVDRATRRVRVSVDPGGDPLMTAVRSVQATGVEIDDIALRQPTLDEVFLALTGKPLQENAAGLEPQTDAA